MLRLRLWHRRLSWLALLPWAWFALSGGSLIVAHLTRELRAPVAASEAPAPPEAQLAAALTLDNEKIRRIDFATAALSLHVQLAGAHSFYGMQLQPAEDSDWVEWLTRLHRGKFAGQPGQIIFSVLAAFLIVFVMTGILLWRPRKTRGAREWHRLLGACFTLPLLMLFFTGGVWNLSLYIRQAPGNGPAVGSAEDWRAAFAGAARFDSPLKSLHKTPGHILAELQDGTRVYRNAAGEEKVFRPWTRAGWIEPFINIHSGRIWGGFGRGLAALTAVSALVLLATGLALQSKRRKARPARV